MGLCSLNESVCEVWQKGFSSKEFISLKLPMKKAFVWFSTANRLMDEYGFILTEQMYLYANP